MDLEEAIQQAWSGRAILFTGAGFSRGAINLRGEPFKNGWQLAVHLAKKAGLSGSVGLEDAAEEFISIHGADALIAELQAEFKAKQILPAHKQLAKAPWKRIYTTNYDDIIETAYSANGRGLTPITLRDNIRETPKDVTLCVHLNGYVDRLSRETVSSDIKLTDTSYLTASIAESPWSVLFRQDLESAQAVFFVGYSIWDLDIRRILFEHESLKNKSFFVLGPTPDPSIARRVARFGSLLKVDAEHFASQLAAKEVAHPEESGPIPYCVQKYDAQPPSEKLGDSLIFDLLLFGRLRGDFVWNTVHGGDRYCLVRNAVNAALKQIDAGTSAVVLHSDLGNGKTVALEVLKCMAAEKQYAVYTITKQAESLYEELEQAFSATGKKVFVIDNYPDWLDVLEFFGTHAPDNTTLVLSARTATNDVLVDRAMELLRTGNLTEIGVDKLGPDELDWVLTYFNDFGLWGDLAAWSRPKKLDYLTRICGAQWHAVLIKLLESPQIQTRLQSLFETLRGRKKHAEVIVSILILSVIGETPSPSNLIDLCGQTVLEASFRRDQAIRNLIDFGTNELRIRSSVAGEFMLQRIVDPNLTVQSLVSLAKAADKAANASRYYFSILKTLMRYGSLQALLPEKHRRRMTLTYYESIKGLDHAKRNPLFWLQYAIASLVDAEKTEEFERAEKYFKTAYSLAEGRDFWDSFQIDNHYARFLLTRAISLGDVATCMRAFREARKLIHNEIERERLRYGYRVATLYADFYEKFESALSPQQKEEIQRAAKHVCERIEKLPLERQNQRYVHTCWERLQKILEGAI
jgi:hypothetical protein